MNNKTSGGGWRTQRGAIGQWMTQQERGQQRRSLSHHALGMEDDTKNWKAGEKGTGNVLLFFVTGLGDAEEK